MKMWTVVDTQNGRRLESYDTRRMARQIATELDAVYHISHRFDIEEATENPKGQISTARLLTITREVQRVVFNYLVEQIGLDTQFSAELATEAANGMAHHLALTATENGVIVEGEK